MNFQKQKTVVLLLEWICCSHWDGITDSLQDTDDLQTYWKNVLLNQEFTSSLRFSIEAFQEKIRFPSAFVMWVTVSTDVHACCNCLLCMQISRRESPSIMFNLSRSSFKHAGWVFEWQGGGTFVDQRAGIHHKLCFSITWGLTVQGDKFLLHVRLFTFSFLKDLPEATVAQMTFW